MNAATSSAITLRRATPADAATLAALGARTFRDAFGAQNTAEDMDAYLAKTYTEAAQRRELEDPAWHTLLAEHDGEAIAFAQVRTGRAYECVTGPAPVELYRIYVDRGWHGHGVAHALMEEVIALSRSLRGQTLYLGVWEHNHRALAFYAKYGFVDVGERSFQLGSTVDRDRIVSRPI
jgi:GNAT superfamily N-acetyltransferase